MTASVSQVNSWLIFAIAALLLCVVTTGAWAMDVPVAKMNDIKFVLTHNPGETITITGRGALNEIGWDKLATLTAAFDLVLNVDTTTIPKYRMLNNTAITGIAGKGLKSIEMGAFTNCTNLARASLPEGLRGIEEAAFRGCTSLTSIELPSTLVEIGKNPFEECTSLTSISSRSASFSTEDGILYNDDKTTLIVYPAGRPGPFTIPCFATTIGPDAFYGCTDLTSVTLPPALSLIESNPFRECTSLTSIVSRSPSFLAEGGVLYNHDKTILIVYSAGLSGSFTAPRIVTSIGDLAFADCAGLTSVSLPL